MTREDYSALLEKIKGAEDIALASVDVATLIEEVNKDINFFEEVQKQNEELKIQNEKLRSINGSLMDKIPLLNVEKEVKREEKTVEEKVEDVEDLFDEDKLFD